MLANVHDSAEHGRVPELDGLRGIAIAMVLWLHASVAPFQNFLWRPLVGEVGTRILLTAGTGVDVFFVLSGFLIGGIALEGRGSERFYRRFYTRRTARIFPLYFALLALSLLPLGRFDLMGRLVPLPIAAYATFTANIFSSLGIPDALALGPLWSICVEEQFYVLAPLLLRVLPWRAVPALCIGGACVSAALRAAMTYGVLLTPFDPGVFTLSRLDGLALGVLGAWLTREPASVRWLKDHTRAVLGSGAAALIAFFVTSQNDDELHSVGLSLIAWSTLSAILVVTTGSAPRLSRALRARPLRWLGRHSYFLYLFHMTFLIWGRLLFFEGGMVSGFALMRVDACSMLVLMGVAALSWRFIEAPLLRFARTLFPARIDAEGTERT